MTTPAQLTNAAKREIEIMGTEQLKNFQRLVDELAKHEEAPVADYFTLMFQAIEDELYKRKETIIDEVPGKWLRLK